MKLNRRIDLPERAIGWVFAVGTVTGGWVFVAWALLDRRGLAHTWAWTYIVPVMVVPGVALLLLARWRRWPRVTIAGAVLTVALLAFGVQWWRMSTPTLLDVRHEFDRVVLPPDAVLDSERVWTSSECLPVSCPNITRRYCPIAGSSIDFDDVRRSVRTLGLELEPYLGAYETPVSGRFWVFARPNGVCWDVQLTGSRGSVVPIPW